METMKNVKRNFTIGRDAACDIRIADDSVSRVHAEMTLTEDGALILRDCGSRNGTSLVRGGKTTPMRQETIRSSDQIRFGEAWVAAADLFSILQQKFPQASSAMEGADSRKPSGPPAKGTKLVRCGCGTIKPVHQACPECGQ